MYFLGVLNITLVHGGLVALLWLTCAAWGSFPVQPGLWVTVLPGAVGPLLFPCLSRAGLALQLVPVGPTQPVPWAAVRCHRASAGKGVEPCSG